MESDDIIRLRAAKKKDSNLMKGARYNSDYWHRLRYNIMTYRGLIKQLKLRDN